MIMKNTIVTILTVDSREKAWFIKDKLEFKGIPCFLTGESFNNTGTKTSEIRKIKVKTQDVEKALEILLNLHSKFDLKEITQEEHPEMKKILVPIDLSEYTLNVCKYAVSLAKKINAEIKFLHVYRDPSENGNPKNTTSWEKHSKLASEQALEKAQKKLVKFSKKMEEQIPEKDFLKVRLHFSLQKGEPIYVIKAISEKYQPHLIILGPKGKHDKSNIFIGSVTTKVIESSAFPILTIPKSANLPDHKLKIMYATNFEEADNKSLEALMKIVEPFETEIHCIHFNAENDHLKKEKVNELNQSFKMNYPGVNLQCDLFENKDLLRGFEKFINEQDIDIVSFSSPKRNLIYKIFNSNKLKQMVSASKIPMLIFRV